MLYRTGFPDPQTVEPVNSFRCRSVSSWIPVHDCDKKQHLPKAQASGAWFVPSCLKTQNGKAGKLTINITPSTRKSEHLTHPEYRADIDGLRAIAVLSVVGFHAFPSWIKAGFIGVDIFFVISGYLISTIIFENLERNSFSFVEFYSRRVKRIFPALLLVLIAGFAFGWFALLADEYKQLGKHIASGAGFVSNIVLWSEQGYFDTAAETKPLLHLWSLGIEEQFYICWPLLLWFAWKRRFNLLVVTATVASVSFALNILKINSDAVAAFYSPQTRFWELSIGSCLAYLTLFNQRTLQRFKTGNENMQSFLGAALLAVGALLITKERSFPGWWALLPTLGAAMIISAGSKAWLNRYVLSNRVLVWFGLISFPLYLWHWTLLSFTRVVQGKIPSDSTRCTAVFISIALAFLTYRFIEKPIRFGNRSNAKVLFLALLIALTGCVGYSCYKYDGFQEVRYRTQDRIEFSRYFENSLPDWKYFEETGIPEKYRFDCGFYDIAKYREGKTTRTPLNQIAESCYQRSMDKEKVVFIWGDSHAQQLYYGLNNNLPQNWQILMVASSGCRPSISIQEDSTTNYCDRSNWFAMKTIKDTKPDVVIIAQEDKHQYKSMKATAETLKEIGIGKTVFMGPSPHWKRTLPHIIMRKLWDENTGKNLRGNR